VLFIKSVQNKINLKIKLWIFGFVVPSLQILPFIHEYCPSTCGKFRHGSTNWSHPVLFRAILSVPRKPPTYLVPTYAFTKCERTI
jgi:hypothetical protein